VILAADHWTSNAELIADVAKLYISPTAKVVDLTYGKGIWWKKFRPDDLTISEHDFRLLPSDWRNTFDVVAFDPPYVSLGGRSTSTIPQMTDHYGLIDAQRSPAALHVYNMEGLQEAVRVARPGGLVLVKYMDYVSSGKLQPCVQWLLRDADFLGLQLFDRFIHVGNPGPQPTKNLDGSPRRQVHARRNLSELFVFKKERYA